MRNQTTKKAPFNRGDEDLMMAMRSIWLGRRDSNPRMPVPKTGALPLGHAPITDRSLPYLLAIHKRYIHYHYT
jgi:hypothetical protein